MVHPHCALGCGQFRKTIGPLPTVHWYEDNLAEIVTFDMGEQVEPLSLKVLRISGYLMIRSSYLNILFTVLSPLDFWVFTPQKFIKNHFWNGWTGRAFISKGSQNFRIFDDMVKLLKHFIYRALNPGFLRIYPPKIKRYKNSLKS